MHCLFLVECLNGHSGVSGEFTYMEEEISEPRLHPVCDGVTTETQVCYCDTNNKPGRGSAPSWACMNGNGW